MHAYNVNQSNYDYNRTFKFKYDKTIMTQNNILTPTQQSINYYKLQIANSMNSIRKLSDSSQNRWTL